MRKHIQYMNGLRGVINKPIRVIIPYQIHYKTRDFTTKPITIVAGKTIDNKILKETMNETMNFTSLSTDTTDTNDTTDTTLKTYDAIFKAYCAFERLKQAEERLYKQEEDLLLLVDRMIFTGLFMGAVVLVKHI